MHLDARNAGAVFQVLRFLWHHRAAPYLRTAASLCGSKWPSRAKFTVEVASQFNCLEMVGPGTRPEDGVTIYAKDATQGPACALACPAATVFRNYFAFGGQGGKNQVRGERY